MSDFKGECTKFDIGNLRGPTSKWKENEGEEIGRGRTREGKQGRRGLSLFLKF